ncbi:MAG: hypothetical protein ABIZ72_02710 [Candidatus Limnocylindrales bacterium]
MADQRSTDDVGPILATWLDAVAPARPPERLLEEAFARTMAARQLPVYPWHRVRVGRAQGAPGSRIGGIALAGVALALVTALATGLFPRFDQGIVGQPSPSPIATPSPSLPPASAPSTRPATSGSPFPSPIVVEPTAAIPVSGAIALASDGTSIWLFTAAGDLMRIDPQTNSVVATVRLDPATDEFQTVAGNAAGLWVTDWTANTVLRFDPRTLRSVASISTAAMSKGLLVTSGAVWIANTRGGSVERLDPATNKVTVRIPVGPIGPSGPNWLTRGFGSIWVGVPNSSFVARISESRNTVEAKIEVPAPASPCGGMATTTTSVWITSCDGSNFVAQIDPVTNTVVGTIDLGGRGYGLAIVADRPWTSPNGGQIVRLDPTAHAVDRVVAPGAGFTGGGDIVVAAGSVWVIDAAASRVLRLPIAAFGG